MSSFRAAGFAAFLPPALLLLFLLSDFDATAVLLVRVVWEPDDVLQKPKRDEKNDPTEEDCFWPVAGVALETEGPGAIGCAEPNPFREGVATTPGAAKAVAVLSVVLFDDGTKF